MLSRLTPRLLTRCATCRRPLLLVARSYSATPRSPKRAPVVSADDPSTWPETGRANSSASTYLSLAKSRLTLFVVSSAVVGYAMAPGGLALAPLAACLAGTALASASANAFNQLLEIPYDSQMARTRTRPLVTGKASPLAAAAFAVASGACGVGLLATLASPLSGALAAANIGLYAGLYTPAKRLTTHNTALGAIVGAIPPLIGWSASTGGVVDIGGLLLALLLFSWQFPHFHALSWGLRGDYSRAGYRMASVLEPDKCRRSALLQSGLFSTVCYFVAHTGLTSWFFFIDTLPLNAALLYLASGFFRHGDSASSRRLFRFTLANLPAVFLLMLISRTPDDQREEARRRNLESPPIAFWH